MHFLSPDTGDRPIPFAVPAGVLTNPDGEWSPKDSFSIEQYEPEHRNHEKMAI